MVHIKHKCITQPTLMPEDTIVKALNDLTNALKQKRNNKGITEYEALQKIDKILNNIPATEQKVPSMTPKQVTFDKMVGNTFTQQINQQSAPNSKHAQ